MSRATPAGRRTYNAHAVVTGAGSGIGRAFAWELAQRGGQVVCADLNLATAQRTAEVIRTNGGHATAVECDVSVEQDVFDLAEAADRWLDRPVDLVVNNAGIGAGGRPVGEISLEDWRFTLGVNLWGVVHGCHVFTPRLRALGRGGIINVGSTASFAAAPQMSPYNVSKAAVLALSETLAAELSGTGIAVSVLCPTFVRTNIIGGDRISAAAARVAALAMKWTGAAADHVARTTLNAHDRGRLYVVPQLDARLVWQLKRHLPVQYTRVIGLLGRLGPRVGLPSPTQRRPGG